jgi:hypothetical protein
MQTNPVEFWLAQFETDDEGGTGTVIVAIECFRLGPAEYAVAISRVNEPPELGLTCYIAFANSVAACDLARESGFPVLEAEIECDDVKPILTVVAPFIPDSKTDGQGAGMLYETPLMTLQGAAFGQSNGGAFKLQKTGGRTRLDVTYCQSVLQPCPGQPDNEITIELPAQRWPRIVERQEFAEITLQVEPAREPNLNPLANRTYGAQIWSGSVPHVDSFLRPRIGNVKRGQERRVAADGCARAKRGRRSGVVASRVYRFEKVEALGFRIDLSEFGVKADRVLERLIAPLNFHRKPEAQAAGDRRTAPLADFWYRAASRTLVIELLRYGRMMYSTRRERDERGRYRGDRINPNDYGSQHELLVRVLVGRLDDDDTAQARNPAVFVPAIFVDNPISKVVGRELLGFDKQLACFCIEGDDDGGWTLLPDGRLRRDFRDCLRNGSRGRLRDRLPGAAPDDPQPLVNVSHIRYVSEVGKTDGASILDLDLESDTLNEEAFTTVDPKLVSGRSWLAGVRWRQTDFDAAEFRRWFARPVIADGVSGMRSVQVSPVDHRRQEKIWIPGNFVADRVGVAFPVGVASLTLHAPEMAPEPWRLLQELLGGTNGCPAHVAVPTGAWYRLKLAMNLRINDGLRW